MLIWDELILFARERATALDAVRMRDIATAPLVGIDRAGEGGRRPGVLESVVAVTLR